MNNGNGKKPDFDEEPINRPNTGGDYDSDDYHATDQFDAIRLLKPVRVALDEAFRNLYVAQRFDLITRSAGGCDPEGLDETKGMAQRWDKYAYVILEMLNTIDQDIYELRSLCDYGEAVDDFRHFGSNDI